MSDAFPASNSLGRKRRSDGHHRLCQNNPELPAGVESLRDAGEVTLPGLAPAARSNFAGCGGRVREPRGRPSSRTPGLRPATPRPPRRPPARPPGGRHLPARPRARPARALTVLAARPVRLSHRKSVMAAAMRPESRHPRGDEVRLHLPQPRDPGTARPPARLPRSRPCRGSAPGRPARQAPCCPPPPAPPPPPPARSARRRAAPPPPGARSLLPLLLGGGGSPIRPLRAAAAAAAGSLHVLTHARPASLPNYARSPAPRRPPPPRPGDPGLVTARSAGPLSSLRATPCARAFPARPPGSPPPARDHARAESRAAAAPPCPRPPPGGAPPAPPARPPAPAHTPSEPAEPPPLPVLPPGLPRAASPP
uniref:basic proline-rich protein-like n=1 Tax=Jaculus jaculus TaxID=51337 RepID=UPI001E1B5A9C|nr:basic proline-rich protein-like [Jaculus jaculus]